MVTADLSLISLVSHASALVQVVLLILLLASLSSWTMIFQKHAALRRALRAADDFEERFWSGTELTRLYNQITGRKKGRIAGMDTRGSSTISRNPPGSPGRPGSNPRPAAPCKW